jgi:hypothetical protein
MTCTPQKEKPFSNAKEQRQGQKWLCLFFDPAVPLAAFTFAS